MLREEDGAGESKSSCWKGGWWSWGARAGREMLKWWGNGEKSWKEGFGNGVRSIGATLVHG